MVKGLISLALLVVAVPSHAVVYGGNPHFTIQVERAAGDLTSGSVVLTKVRIHPCSGSDIDYPVGTNIDPVAVYSVQVAGGNLCGATVFWGTDMDLDGDNGSAFELLYTPNTTSVTFASTISPVALTPWSVVSGTPGAAGPFLYVDML